MKWDPYFTPYMSKFQKNICIFHVGKNFLNKITLTYACQKRKKVHA